MNNINQIIIEGNVEEQPQVQRTSVGKAFCVIPIVVTLHYRGDGGKYVDEVSYFDVEVHGEEYSTTIARYALKDRGVKIIGRLKQDRWEDTNGKQHSKVKIVAEHIDFKPMKEKLVTVSAEGNN